MNTLYNSLINLIAPPAELNYATRKAGSLIAAAIVLFVLNRV